nr:uncharacterized protein LOC129384990 [Dermacentor andersoni]
MGNRQSSTPTEASEDDPVPTLPHLVQRLRKQCDSWCPHIGVLKARMGNRHCSKRTEDRKSNPVLARTSDAYVVPEWRACFFPASTRPEELRFASRKEAVRAQALALSAMSPEGLSVDEAFHVLRQAEVHLAKQGVDMSRQCGKSDTGSCYLEDMVDTVNTCLVAVNMCLRNSWSGPLVLSSVDTPFTEPAKEAAVKCAAVVVRWLVLRHRCILALDLDDSKCRKYREFAGLWLECLGKENTLRVLRVKLPTTRPCAGEWPLKEVWQACWLRTLELRHVDLSGTADVAFEELANFMQRCTQLTELTLSHFMKPLKDPTMLFRALQANRNLTFLSMDISYLQCQHGSLLVEYFGRLPRLKYLTLTSSIEAPAIKLRSFVSAAEHLTYLVAITLEKFSLSLECALALADAVVRNGGLRVLELLNCQWFVLDAGGRQKVFQYIEAPRRVLPLVMILALSRHLEDMTLNLNVFDAEELDSFFKALARNDKVRVVAEHVDQQSIAKISEAARRTRTDARLRLPAVSVNEVGFQAVRDAKVAALSLRTREYCSRGAVYDCLVELPSCGHLNTLELCLNTPLSLIEATPIAELLKSTATLIKLIMDFRVDKVAARTILEALAVNRSVRFLTIKRWTMARRNARFLSAVVQTSRTLLLLRFYGVSDDKTSSQLVASSLAERIADNHTIFCADVRPLRSGHRQPWLVLQAVTLRNKSLLARAVRFATEDIWTIIGFDLQRKRGAEAIDLVAPSYAEPLLSADLPHVLFHRKHKENMRRSWLRIREMQAFMRVTGVVRLRVTCYPEPDGRPQLSALPRDCWLRIRQCLKVGDVLDPTT